MGKQMTCVRWHSRKAGKLRCASFEPAKQVGESPCIPSVGLKGGGRSQWAIRRKKKSCSRSAPPAARKATRKKASTKRKSSKRKSRK